jgi:asparagine synthase (glutamine-hydrolysing)
MCGIAVIWGRRDAGIVEAMLEVLAHRGPDGQGIHVAEGFPGVLGHRRLAIIDPAGGIQPLLAEGDRALVANGMIYNDRALRAELGAPGFRTGSDSESILRCLMARGPDGVGALDGMFAFIMQDGDRLLAGRDPLGIKPLYMGRDDGAILLASEIKALAPFTDRIREVPPGSLIDTRGGSRRYYALPPAEPRFRDLDEAVAALRRTVEASVVKRLRSDVPLGCLLSGGLDSSIVCAVARRHLPELHTFAVGLEESADLKAARRVAQHLGTTHHELVVDPASVLDELPRVIAHLESFDADLVRSAVPCWLVSRLAARHVKVILTGEGADELFAGYRYHRDYADRSELALELRRSLEAMHDVNLQRVDRMTMAHGLEARVPFLDRDLVALAMRLPVGWKLFSEGERRIEKWILRKAFEDLLPEEIVWREKSQFDQGSGFAELLERLAAPLGSDLPGEGVRGPEEAFYRRLLLDAFPDLPGIVDLVGRWSQGRVS